MLKLRFFRLTKRCLGGMGMGMGHSAVGLKREGTEFRGPELRVPRTVLYCRPEEHHNHIHPQHRRNS